MKGGCKIWLQANILIIFLSVTPVEGTPLFRGCKIWPQANNYSYNVFICCICWRDTSIQGTQNLALGKYSYNLFICERFEPRSHFKRLSLIIRVNVVLNRTVVVDSDWRFNNAVVIFRVKVSCITSVDGIILGLLIWLVNYVAMLLVVCQLSRDVILLWRLIISDWCV